MKNFNYTAKSIETNRMKKMMGLLKEEENKVILTSNGLKNSRKFKDGFNRIVRNIFQPNNWGTADKPEIDCYTHQGIIGVYTFADYSNRFKTPSSNWSVINFFNTSGLVLDELLRMYRQSITENESEENFLMFVEDFIRNKMNTKEFENLVVMNLRAITKGSRSENYVFDDLKRKLDAQGDLNFCPGSKTDTSKGEDFIMYKDGKKFKAQVKPLLFFNLIGTKTEVLTKKYPTKGYSPSNIDYIIFHKETTNEYIVMENDTDLKIYNDMKSKKGFIYDKVVFSSLPVKPEEIVFR